MTSFPPPPGFDGHESGTWDGCTYYERECTRDEAALMEAAADAEDRADRGEEEARRDSYFASMRREA